MDDITEESGSSDLSNICEEYKAQANDEEKDLVLPKHLGGSRIHLLLGIKNTNLDPVLIKILPSGSCILVLSKISMVQELYLLALIDHSQRQIKE